MKHSRTTVVMENPIIDGYLDALLATGLYGSSLADVRYRLICVGIEHAITTGVIPRRWFQPAYPYRSDALT